MGTKRFRIFISAVTAELGSYRQSLARDLRRKGLDVCDQENFRQGDATLLEALRDYIRDCDAVVLLVGERCGALATPEHAARLSDIPGFAAYSAASGQARASYTQWELHLAKHYGKRTYTFLTGAGFVPAPGGTPEPPELTACQQAHRAWIKRQGEHYDLLTTADRLAVDMLVQQFPSDPATRPINLPYRSLGTLFKGRDTAMAQLRGSLARTRGASASAIVNAVHGLGGVGKTRLAVEYAWQQREDYNALLFAVASSPEVLRRNLAALAGPTVLGIAEEDTKEDAKVAAALRWLQGNPGWFLVLDNVDTEQAAGAAEELLVNLHAGDVLITSRLSRWSPQVEPLELGVLAPDDAVAFLLERTDRRRRKTASDDADARAIAVELGELALALEQAGAYIAERRLSLAEYLAAWQSSRAEVAGWYDARVMKYPSSLAVTWQTSVAQLSPPARRLLERLAWLAPEPIPESLLQVAVPGDDTAAGEADAALAELERYSLVTRAAEGRTFTVHRLVQDVTRRSLADEAAQQSLALALGWIDAAFVGDPGDVRTWPVLTPLAPHALAIVDRADAAGISEPTARLMSDLGIVFHAKALNGTAESLMRRALAIDEASLAPRHPNVAIRLNNLAGLLQATNRPGEAEPLLRRSLAIDKARFGPNHPNVAVHLNNLAALLQDTNRLGEAEPLLRQALAIDEASLGPDHPKVAIDLNNLAMLLQATKRYAEAEQLLRRALSIDTERFGADHPNVASSLNNLAVLLQATDRLGEVEPLMRRALAIDEASLGPGHPEVARDLNNLAGLLLATNQLGEAEPLLRRVVAIFETVERDTGHMHPNYAGSLNNLAQLLQDTNRLGEAEPLMRRALAIDEASFGPDHPDVAIRLNNLAALLQATSRLGEAEPLMRRHLVIFLEFTRDTGHEHPHLRAALASYAGILRDLGRSDAEIEAEIAALVREVRGPRE